MAKQTLDPPDSYAAPIFKTLRRDPAYKAVSGVMAQHILSGRLKTGTALPTELGLAAQFGVNRSTIREAMRQLEQEGLVERRGGKKMFVTLPGLFDLAPRAQSGPIGKGYGVPVGAKNGAGGLMAFADRMLGQQGE